MHKYERVRDQIAELAERQGLGTQIPPEKALAAQFGVSAMTVRRALQILTDSGVLIGIPGRGTFVARPRVTKVARLSRSFSEAIRASGRRPSSRLIAVAMRSAYGEEERRLIDEGADDHVFEVRRVRLADGVVIGYEVTILNAALLPGLLGHDLKGSLYELIERRYGLPITRTGTVVSSRLPTEEEAGILEIAEGTPCLQTVVTSQARDGLPLERTVAIYRGDRYEVEI